MSFSLLPNGHPGLHYKRSYLFVCWMSWNWSVLTLSFNSGRLSRIQFEIVYVLHYSIYRPVTMVGLRLAASIYFASPLIAIDLKWWKWAKSGSRKGTGAQESNRAIISFGVWVSFPFITAVTICHMPVLEVIELLAFYNKITPMCEHFANLCSILLSTNAIPS